MAWTPPSDAVEFTPPQDAVEFTPPSDGEASNTFLQDVGTSLKNAFTSPMDMNDSAFMRGVKNPIQTIMGGVETGANLASGAVAPALGLAIPLAQGTINAITGDNTNPIPDYTQGMEMATYAPRTEFGKQIQSTITTPVMEQMIPLVPIMGGLALPHTPKEFKSIPREFGKARETFRPPSDAVPFNEQVMAERTLTKMDDKIARVSEDLSNLYSTYERLQVPIEGADHPIVLAERELAHLKLQREELNNKLTGDVTDQVRTEAQIKEGRAIKAAEQSIEDAPANAAKPLVDDSWQVAKDKIDEAAGKSPSELADLILDTQDKLDSTPIEKSSLREALKHEIETYEALAKGDSVVAEATPREPIKNKINPTSDEVTQLLLDHNNVGDVLTTLKSEGIGTPGQKILIDILQKIPRVLTSTFEVSKSELFDKNGNPARGMYDSAKHSMEIHPGANVKTILHEAVHTATAALMDHGTSVYVQRLTSLYDKYKASNGDGSYGFTNAKEFISEALTNPKFQKLLSNIKSENVLGKKVDNLWQAIKRTVKDALGIPEEARTALDDVMDAGRDVMNETASKSEGFFQKLSEVSKESPISYEAVEPTPKTVRGIVGRNFFGMPAMEGFYRDHPVVQKAYKQIMEAKDITDKIVNQLWHGTSDVVRNEKRGFFASLSKIEARDSAIVAVKETSNASMAKIHDLFRDGMEQELDYQSNREKNGQHLTPSEIKTYNTLSKLFGDMYQSAVGVQKSLGKKHILPFKTGWYPANRRGNYSVAISYGDFISHYETFPTRRAAEVFKEKIGKESQMKFLEVSEILDNTKEQEKTPNKEMADIIASKLAKSYPKAANELVGQIEKLLETMQLKGGKLGKHHEHRSGVSGYKGNELFRSTEERGKSFKDGIQREVNNFATNMKALQIKTKLQGLVEDNNFYKSDPVGHAAVEQLYESALGRNSDLFAGKINDWATHVVDIVDKIADASMRKVLGRGFEGKEKSVTTHITDTSMRAFYATKMMAKPVFALAQLLTTAMIIPEMAQNNHGIRAFYSFGKGVSKLLTRDKELMDVLFKESQEFGTIEQQFRESLNLDKHTGIHTNVEKVINGLEDYVLLGKLGKVTDSMSRAISFVTAYTHFKDLGLSREAARYEARRLTEHAMNIYGRDVSAPIYEKLGVMGEGMKPLTSFSQNQLGNLAKYWMQAKKGNYGPLMAVGLIATATGGILGLPFIQEYERARQILEKFMNVQMPSILEIMYGDESFFDRLELNPEDVKQLKDMATYGPLPALTGIDLTSTSRSNETVFSVMAAIMLGQEDASKLLPIMGATVQSVGAIPALGKAIAGKGTEGEDKKAIDSLIVGPLNFGAKKVLGAGTTRLFGENTGMLSTGKAGNADIPETNTSKLAAVLGSKTVEQKRIDQQAFEQQMRDKVLQSKIQRTSTMFVETGKPEYLEKMVDLGMNNEQIKNAIGTGAYNKLVEQQIRYFRSSKGKVENKKVLNELKTGAMQ